MEKTAKIGDVIAPKCNLQDQDVVIRVGGGWAVTSSGKCFEGDYTIIKEENYTLKIKMRRKQ